MVFINVYFFYLIFDYFCNIPWPAHGLNNSIKKGFNRFDRESKNESNSNRETLKFRRPTCDAFECVQCSHRRAGFLR